MYFQKSDLGSWITLQQLILELTSHDLRAQTKNLNLFQSHMEYCPVLASWKHFPTTGLVHWEIVAHIFDKVIPARSDLLHGETSPELFSLLQQWNLPSCAHWSWIEVQSLHSVSVHQNWKKTSTYPLGAQQFVRHSKGKSVLPREDTWLESVSTSYSTHTYTQYS